MEVVEADNFCGRCGVNLTQTEVISNTPEGKVKAIIVKRIEGIKRKDAEIIMSLVDRERYTKFDDWSPFERQDSEALDRESEALKVLKEYNYKISDWKIDFFENVAIASFIINYQGTIRDRIFKIKSRVTTLLVKTKAEWKLVHEHWSRIPERFSEERKKRRRRFPW